MLSHFKGLHLGVDGGEPYKQVEIQPVVIFCILDHFLRRENESERVIGALLGTVEDGIVYVNNCFPVTHIEVQKSVTLFREIYDNRLKLHAEIYPEEQVVGWYSTFKKEGAAVYNANLINEFFGKEIGDVPVHLLVDPTLSEGELGIRCQYARPIQFSERGIIQQQYRPLRHILRTYQAERLAIERMIKDKGQPLCPPLSDLNALTRTLHELVDMLDRISAYIKKVIAGETEGSSKIGKLIDNTLSLLPLDSTQFQALFSKGLQDVLMVVYLANLTKTHLLLAQNTVGAE